MKLSALLFGVLATGFTTAQFCDVLFCSTGADCPWGCHCVGWTCEITMSNPGRRGWGTVNAWEKEAGITETAAGKHSNGYVDETRFDVDAPEAAEKRGPGPRKIEEGKKARV